MCFLNRFYLEAEPAIESSTGLPTDFFDSGFAPSPATAVPSSAPQTTEQTTSEVQVPAVNPSNIKNLPQGSSFVYFVVFDIDVVSLVISVWGDSGVSLSSFELSLKFPEIHRFFSEISFDFLPIFS